MSRLGLPKLFLLIAGLTMVLAGPNAQADLIFEGGSIQDGNNWLDDANDSLGALPGAGDIGIINVDGTTGGNLNGTLAGATINHTDGTISGAYNANSAGLVWNLQGGTIAGTGNLNANGSTLDLQSGLLQFAGALIVNTVNGIINVSGDADLQDTSGAFDLFLNNNSAQFNIDPTWTGSFIGANTTEQNWIGSLVNAASRSGNGGAVNNNRLINVGGTDITAANLGDFFVVTPLAGGGSSLSLIAVPEPSSAALLGLVALGLGARRRR